VIVGLPVGEECGVRDAYVGALSLAATDVALIPSPRQLQGNAFPHPPVREQNNASPTSTAHDNYKTTPFPPPGEPCRSSPPSPLSSTTTR
jgi:hypothetical protein